MSDICKVLQTPDRLERRTNPRAVVFGFCLRAMRERAGVSLRDMARECRVKIDVLSGIELGRVMPPQDWTLDIMAGHLEDAISARMEEL